METRHLAAEAVIYLVSLTPIPFIIVFLERSDGSIDVIYFELLHYSTKISI